MAAHSHINALVSWGDVPTWIAAIGTVGAFVAAFIQIGTERRRRLQREASDRLAEHIAQARLIAAIRGPEERSHEAPGDRSAIDMVNSSPEPVYRLVVGFVFLQGAGLPATIEEWLEHKDVYKEDWLRYQPFTTVAILPSGTHRVWLRGNVGTAMGGRKAAEVAFADRAGSHWIRRGTGQLEELPVDPIEYFQQRGMYGPHDLHTPERVA